jgi:hypothetical protein
MTVGELIDELSKYDRGAFVAVALASDRFPPGAQVAVQRVGHVAGWHEGAPGWVGLFAHDKNAPLADESGEACADVVPVVMDGYSPLSAAHRAVQQLDAVAAFDRVAWKFGAHTEAALRQLAKADAATSRGYAADAVKDVDFAADEAATREVFAKYVRDDIARSFNPEIVAALYPPPDEPDAPHVVTT